MFRLGQCILPRTRVQNQHDFMRRRSVDFAHDPNHFFQFFHKIILVVQATRRIGNQNIYLPCASCLQCVKNDRRTVCSRMLSYNRYVVTHSPYLKLLNCRRPKRITRCQHDRMPLAHIVLRQLADSGRLANTIDAYHQNDKWLVPMNLQWNFTGPKQRQQLLLQGTLQCVRPHQLIA